MLVLSLTCIYTLHTYCFNRCDTPPTIQYRVKCDSSISSDSMENISMVPTFWSWRDQEWLELRGYTTVSRNKMKIFRLLSDTKQHGWVHSHALETWTLIGLLVSINQSNCLFQQLCVDKHGRGHTSRKG